MPIDQGNNFSLLRFIAASLVLISHSYPLSGDTMLDPLARLIGILDLASASVIAFFVISGFLIMKSATKASSIQDFCAARFLRIWPGLLLIGLISALIIGPLATQLDLASYFSKLGTLGYPMKLMLLNVGAPLPGVFIDNPLPAAINGSLWTIQIEVWLYAIVAGLMLIRVAQKPLLLLIALSAIYAFLIYAPDLASHFHPQRGSFMAKPLIGSFFLGAIFYVYRYRIPASPTLALSLLALTFSLKSTEFFIIAFYVAFAYITLYLCVQPGNALSRLTDRADLSYGIYILAFPFQQFAVHLFNLSSPTALTLIVYPVVILLAYASWTFVEKPALTLRHSVPCLFNRINRILANK